MRKSMFPCSCSSLLRPRQQKMVTMRQVLYLPLRFQPTNNLSHCCQLPQTMRSQSTDDPQQQQQQQQQVGYIFTANSCGKSCIYNYENHKTCFKSAENGAMTKPSAYEDDSTAGYADTLSLEYYCIVINSDYPRIKRSWISLHQDNNFQAAGAEMDSSAKKTKRWSFCYGEDRQLDVLTCKVHGHDMKRKSWLLQSWYKWKLSRCKSHIDLFSRTTGNIL